MGTKGALKGGFTKGASKREGPSKPSFETPFPKAINLRVQGVAKKLQRQIAIQLPTTRIDHITCKCCNESSSRIESKEE